MQYIDGNVFSADNQGNVVGVNVFDGGEPATLGGTVSASVIRADGVTVAVTGTLSGNKCSVVLPQTAYAVPGVISIIIKLTSDSDITTVCAVVGNVYMSTTDSVIDPGTVVPSIETLIAEIEAAVASIPADYSSLWTSLAPAFSSSTTYTAGQYVTYDGGLYRFIKSHTGSWATDDVVSVNIGNEIQNIDIVSSSMYSNLPNMFDNATFVYGKYINENGVVTDAGAMCYSSLIEIVHPNDYTICFRAFKELHGVRIHGYDKDGNWKRQLVNIATSSQKLNNFTETTVSANDCKYIRISISKYYNGFYMCQSVADKDLTLRYQDDVNTFGLAQRKNLLYGVSWTEYAWLNSQGEVDGTVSDAEFGKCSDYIPVVTNKRYYLAITQKTNRPNPAEIKVCGYDDNGDFVNWLRFIQPDEQTPGSVSVVSFWIRDDVTQIRICMKNYVFASLSVSNDFDEAVTESLYDDSIMDWVIGGINWVSGEDTTNTERIRTDGWANLAADFIRGENVYISMFVYDRDQSFKGVWNGHGLDYGKMTWFDFINVREVHKVLDKLYPNFIFKMTARGPGTSAMTVRFGTRIHFYIRKIPYASVGAYLNWAVIGASSDNGWFGGQDHPEYAWPVMLSKRVGNTVTNYSKGGRTLKQFINDTGSTGLGQLLSDPAKELYVITLGGNDASGTDPIGSITDITGYSDWHDYPDTIYGNYGRALEQIMAHAPNAKFVLTTPPGLSYNERHLAVDNAIREISDHYSVPCVEWESDPFMNSNVYTKHQVSGHPTKVLYSGKALAFDRLFSRCFAENTDYFA